MVSDSSLRVMLRDMDTGCILVNTCIQGSRKKVPNLEGNVGEGGGGGVVAEVGKHG